MSMRTWCRKKAHYMMHREGIEKENRRFIRSTGRSFFAEKWYEFAERGRFEKRFKRMRRMSVHKNTVSRTP